LRLAIVEKEKVLFLQIVDDLAILISYDNAKEDEVHPHFEGGLRIAGDDLSRSSRRRSVVRRFRGLLRGIALGVW
jgi:hypothetical protein